MACLLLDVNASGPLPVPQATSSHPHAPPLGSPRCCCCLPCRLLAVVISCLGLHWANDPPVRLPPPLHLWPAPLPACLPCQQGVLVPPVTMPGCPNNTAAQNADRVA